MIAWVFTFQKLNYRESFDYFTGIGCGPKPTPQMKSQALASFPGIPKASAVDLRAAQMALKGWTPDPLEVLWSIAQDGNALEMTFEDWASEFGYDSDSRKAEKIYRACQDNALRLKKLLSQDQIQSIKELEF